jgi:hypothetical protein
MLPNYYKSFGAPSANVIDWLIDWLVETVIIRMVDESID